MLYSEYLMIQYLQTVDHGFLTFCCAVDCSPKNVQSYSSLAVTISGVHLYACVHRNQALVLKLLNKVAIGSYQCCPQQLLSSFLWYQQVRRSL